MTTKYFNFHLIDGTGAKMQDDAELYVSDGRIVSPCEAEKEVDLGGAYVHPGLMDGHVHISAPPFDMRTLDISSFTITDYITNGVKNLEAFLKQGVTFIRDVGSTHAERFELAFRKHLVSGFLKGPGMLCSGPMMAITGGHGRESYTCDGVEECRKAARTIIAMDVDLLKMAVTGGVGTKANDPNAYQFNLEEISAVVHEAKKVGKRVAVHAHGTQGIKNALIAGVNSIEHGTLLDDEAVDLMLKNDAWLVPTLAVSHTIMTKPMPDFMKEKIAKVNILHEESLKKAYAKGVKLGTGTDLLPSFSSFQIQLEISLLMKVLGISVIEGIKIATKNTSELLGIEANYGTLEVGKFADFVVVKDNPCDDVENLKNIVNVYQKGNVVA